ncbi:MAG: hypothetical protein H0X41_11455 [Chitinophagaceae bacterium]|nr:hypothetical protein [Chitinophagaceae bacterium]
MEIQEFVKTVLVDIVNGLHQASNELSKTAPLSGRQSLDNAVINPVRNIHDVFEPDQKSLGRRTISSIEMSIAVTIGQASESGGKAGISVAWFSAEVNAGSGTSSNSTVSTVKFSVPVAFPVWR